MLWVVAGCLFELSFEEPVSWLGPDPAVTLLADEERDGRWHLRFRAEQPGEAVLRFREAGAVTVHIAPERLG